jgi:hypothetical protein
MRPHLVDFGTCLVNKVHTGCGPDFDTFQHHKRHRQQNLLQMLYLLDTLRNLFSWFDSGTDLLNRICKLFSRFDPGTDPLDNLCSLF